MQEAAWGREQDEKERGDCHVSIKQVWKTTA